jgi:hypothetical protein
MSIFSRLIFEPPGGQFREYIGLSTYFVTENLDLYRKLLPKEFSMPELPVVYMFAANYMKMFPWPLSPYQEWAVSLSCTYRAEPGIHCITMPVTKWLPMNGGRTIGFPKYIVDSISLEHLDQDWLARGMYKGREQMSLEFRPGLTRQLAPWEDALLADEAFFKQIAIFQLVPPSLGPKIYNINVKYVVPSHWTPQNGMLKVKVDPNEPWAGLVQEDEAFPGTFNHFKGGCNLAWTVVR